MLAKTAIEDRISMIALLRPRKCTWFSDFLLFAPSLSDLDDANNLANLWTSIDRFYLFCPDYANASFVVHRWIDVDNRAFRSVMSTIKIPRASPRPSLSSSTNDQTATTVMSSRASFPSNRRNGHASSSRVNIVRKKRVISRCFDPLHRY